MKLLILLSVLFISKLSFGAQLYRDMETMVDTVDRYFDSSRVGPCLTLLATFSGLNKSKDFIDLTSAIAKHSVDFQILEYPLCCSKMPRNCSS